MCMCEMHHGYTRLHEYIIIINFQLDQYSLLNNFRRLPKKAKIFYHEFFTGKFQTLNFSRITDPPVQALDLLCNPFMHRRKASELSDASFSIASSPSQSSWAKMY